MPVKVREIVKREIDVPDLSDRLAKALAASESSVAQLCREVGISRAYWYNLVNDKEEAIALETLRRIETALGADLQISLEGDR